MFTFAVYFTIETMTENIDRSTKWFENYVGSFTGLNDSQAHNFQIKKSHSERVAQNALFLAEKNDFDDYGRHLAFLLGLLHDVGRFKQLLEHGTFNDEKSVDHAELAIKILEEVDVLDAIDADNKRVILKAIQYHNKLKIGDELNEKERLFAQLLRDADKLDILKVLSEYYVSRNVKPNHTLTWELPKGSVVSPAVAKEVLAGKMVSKKNVASEIDVKIMQLSWVYDINFRASFDHLLKNRFLERIYNSMSKNDLVIEIYRKIKVYSENKILQ